MFDGLTSQGADLSATRRSIGVYRGWVQSTSACPMMMKQIAMLVPIKKPNAPRATLGLATGEDSCGANSPQLSQSLAPANRTQLRIVHRPSSRK